MYVYVILTSMRVCIYEVLLNLKTIINYKPKDIKKEHPIDQVNIVKFQRKHRILRQGKLDV